MRGKEIQALDFLQGGEPVCELQVRSLLKNAADFEGSPAAEAV